MRESVPRRVLKTNDAFEKYQIRGHAGVEFAERRIQSSTLWAEFPREKKKKFALNLARRQSFVLLRRGAVPKIYATQILMQRGEPRYALTFEDATTGIEAKAKRIRERPEDSS